MRHGQLSTPSPLFYGCGGADSRHRTPVLSYAVPCAPTLIVPYTPSYALHPDASTPNHTDPHKGSLEASIAAPDVIHTDPSAPRPR